MRGATGIDGAPACACTRGVKKRKVSAMEELKKKFEDNYLTFISIAVGSVALIAAVVWGITALMRRKSCDR